MSQCILDNIHNLINIYGIYLFWGYISHFQCFLCLICWYHTIGFWFLFLWVWVEWGLCMGFVFVQAFAIHIHVWGKGRWARRLIELLNKPVLLGNESICQHWEMCHINPVLGLGHQTCKSPFIAYANSS